MHSYEQIGENRSRGGSVGIQSGTAGGVQQSSSISDHQQTHTIRRPLLTARQAAVEIFGVSERTFHKMREQGMLPMPVRIGPRCLRWLRSELEQATANLPRQTSLERGMPEKLKRGQLARAAARTATQVEA